MGTVNIIGKIFFALFICMNVTAQYCYAQGSVEVFVRDLNGRKVTRVTVGQPFYLHVLMHDIDGNNARVTIEQSRTIPMRRTSVQMRSINGKASTTHIYTARIDTRGLYTIGPVFVDDGTTRYQSNSIQLDVNDTITTDDTKYDHVSLRLIPAKLQAYVGESVPVTLRFYYPHDGIRAERLTQPVLADVVQSSFEGPFIASETSNGVVHEYIEWRCDMIFKKAESYTIPSYTIEYVDRLKSHRSGFFSSFFNAMGAVDHVSSAPVPMHIMPVPTNPAATEFVGVVYDVTASLDHTELAAGQAAVYTIELTTSRHGAPLKAPLLEELPQHVKYYESKVETTSTETITKTRFEYIIQPLQAGEWEIPSQSYTYFDIRDGMYTTLHTDPLYMSVTPALHTSNKNEYKENTQELSDERVSTSDIQPLHEMGPWSYQKDGLHIPWLLFWIISISPLLIISVRKVMQYLLQHRMRTQLERRSKHALAYAHASLKQAKRSGAVDVLPHILKQWYADTWQVPLHHITEVYIHERLKVLNISYQVQQEWHVFWSKLMSYAFAQEQLADTLVKELYKEVEQWLNTLNTLL